MEVWKDIKEGYQISDKGNVRSRINNRHGIGETYHELSPCLNRQGYEIVHLGRGDRRSIHRLVAEAFIPNPDNLPLVRHLDDDPRNNTVENLAWGTQTDNMQDCVKHGRLVGNTHPAIESRKKRIIATSLDRDQTIEFDSCNEAARKLDLWPQHVSRVANGELRQTGGWTFKFASKEVHING